MSVDFFVEGTRLQHDEPTNYLNFANTRAREILDWLGYRDEANSPGLCGRLPAGELAARCRRRLWPIPRNEDPGTETVVEAGDGRATAIIAGRRAGYLPMRTAQLLELAERAGPDGAICFA